MKKYQAVIIILDVIAIIFFIALTVYQISTNKLNSNLVHITVELLGFILPATLSVLGIKTHLSRGHSKKIFAKQYDNIIRNAFQNDRPSYNKLISAIVDYNYNKLGKAIKTLDKLFKTACTTADDYSAVLTFKALCLEEKGLIDDAISTYNELLTYDASCSNAWSNMGLLYAAKGDSKAAEEAYLNAVRYDDSNAYAHNNLGAYYYRTGDVKKALDHALRALELDPKLYQAMSTIALCMAAVGDFETAKKYRDQYVRSGGDAKAIDLMINSAK